MREQRHSDKEAKAIHLRVDMPSRVMKSNVITEEIGCLPLLLEQQPSPLSPSHRVLSSPNIC